MRSVAARVITPTDSAMSGVGMNSPPPTAMLRLSAYRPSEFSRAIRMSMPGAVATRAVPAKGLDWRTGRTVCGSRRPGGRRQNPPG